MRRLMLMKLMIASDIHGSAKWCRKLMEAFETERAERMLLLGDLLYHGPRNDLPDEYAPKQVIEMLNAVNDRLFCVRGNCEAEVDQMVLKFPVMADYCVLPIAGKVIYATHGHLHGKETPPPLRPGDILLCGHTHIPAYEHCDGFTYVNPGSVSIPKNGSAHSYMVLEDGALVWKDLADGSVYKKELF